jgi:uncharacterized membrane protein
MGLIFFTIFPGFIFLKLLNLHKFSKVETIALSIGLSIALLMFSGFVVNQFCLLFNINGPLSSVNLLIFFDFFIISALILLIISNLNSQDAQKTNWSFPSKKIILLMVSLSALPILSILGALKVNFYGNNVVLLAMFVLISFLIIISIMTNKLPKKIYPYVILIISVSLIIHSTLVSDFVLSHGSDIPSELHVFKLTQENQFWNASVNIEHDVFGRLYAMLSITILPTVYANLLNLTPDTIFILIFPIFLSLVAIVFYFLWKNFFGERTALIASFLFMVQATFFTEMMGLMRQIFAELFFVLLLFIIFKTEVPRNIKLCLFTIFSAALIVSHYGIAEIFLLFIIFAWVISWLTKRKVHKITFVMVLLFAILMFAWYVFTLNLTVFNSFLSFSESVYVQLGNFFDPSSRGSTVLAGLGLETSPSILNTVSRVFAYATEALILMGFVSFVAKKFKVNIDPDYMILTVISFVFLGALVIVPGLASTLNMTRFYHVLLFFLSPLFVIGADYIAHLIARSQKAMGLQIKRRKKIISNILIVFILIPYALFQTNFIYEVSGSTSWSLPLTKYRLDDARLQYEFGYITAYDVSAVQWLSAYFNYVSLPVFADGSSRVNVMTSYGMIFYTSSLELTNATILPFGATLYFNTYNVEHQKVQLWNLTDLVIDFDNLNNIYSNRNNVIFSNADPDSI